VFSGTADFSGETQYAVEIVDCTSDPHGVYALTNYPTYPDTRMVSNVAGESLQGVGIGHMMFYASDTTGEFSRTGGASTPRRPAGLTTSWHDRSRQPASAEPSVGGGQRRAYLSVAATSASTTPGVLVSCPASSTTTNSQPGHA